MKPNPPREPRRVRMADGQLYLIAGLPRPNTAGVCRRTALRRGLKYTYLPRAGYVLLKPAPEIPTPEAWEPNDET
jgi:hypothetical protein